MWTHTQPFPSRAFKLNRAFLQGDNIKISNSGGPSSAWCEVTNLVSFQWTCSYDVAMPFVETSTGRTPLVWTKGPRELTHRFDPPYTGKLQIGTDARSDGEPGIFDFFNFREAILLPAEKRPTTVLSLESFYIKNGELLDGGQSASISDWDTVGAVVGMVENLVSFDVDCRGRRADVWMESSAGRQRLDFASVSTSARHTHCFDPPYTGALAISMDKQADPDLSGHIVLGQYRCLKLAAENPEKPSDEAEDTGQPPGPVSTIEYNIPPDSRVTATDRGLVMAESDNPQNPTSVTRGVIGIVDLEWSTNGESQKLVIITDTGSVSIDCKGKGRYVFPAPYSGTVKLVRPSGAPGSTLTLGRITFGKTVPMSVGSFKLQNGTTADIQFFGPCIILNNSNGPCSLSADVVGLINFHFTLPGEEKYIWMETSAGRVHLGYEEGLGDAERPYYFPTPYTGPLRIFMEAASDTVEACIIQFRLFQTIIRI